MHDSSYYKKLGFMCGLEIHQRLATAEKLFCSCSTDFPEDSEIGSIERRQRAVAGELGKMDRSTSFESSRERKFIYKIFKHSSCLVDIDEEPPHRINTEAVDVALMFASAFSLKIPDEIEPMRKQVVDGSDPSSFQRSMLIGSGGSLDVNGRKIPIISMFLEEESSGIVSTTSDAVTYNVDRIGIPLVEIDTDPSIANPKEARDVALKIGLILRLTGRRNGEGVGAHVQRGIGTIRQDVNVSIAGGTRVEIKGLQEIDTVDVMIDNEVERQVKLLEIKKTLLEKKAKVGEAKDLTRQLAGTGAKIIKDAISSNGAVLGTALMGFKGIIGTEIGPDRRLGSEISDYAKMSGVKGIIHSDEDLSKYGLTEAEAAKISAALGLKEGDAFILIASDRPTCEKAMGYAVGRAKMAMAEVPPETRAVLDSKKGTSRFMRPLPGGSRMYPETDAEPVVVGKAMQEKIRKSTVYMDERIAGIRAGISNAQIAEQLVHSPRLQTYEYITSQAKGINLIVATTLLERFKELERSGVEVRIDNDTLLDIFNRYIAGEITKAAIGEIIRYSPKSPKETAKIIKEKKLEKISGKKLADLIKETRSKGGSDVMREIMSKYKFNVEGDEVTKALRA